jgi:hypothetical protein
VTSKLFDLVNAYNQASFFVTAGGKVGYLVTPNCMNPRGNLRQMSGAFTPRIIDLHPQISRYGPDKMLSIRVVEKIMCYNVYLDKTLSIYGKGQGLLFDAKHLAQIKVLM